MDSTVGCEGTVYFASVVVDWFYTDKCCNTQEYSNCLRTERPPQSLLPETHIYISWDLE
jgi:hypothetical protein